MLTTLSCHGLSYASGQTDLSSAFIERGPVSITDCLFVAGVDGVASSLIGLPFSYGSDSLHNFRQRRKRERLGQQRDYEIIVEPLINNGYEF